MRLLYLHIGLHKTGTSYLQKLVAVNARLLANAGLSLAPYDDRQTHNALVTGLLDNGPRHFLNSLKWRKTNRILVTSESLSHAFRDLELAHDLARSARSENIKLKLILVLRRQDLLKESVYSEVVKTWFQGSILEDVHYDYDFNKRVTGLEGAFGRENIGLVLYGGGQAKTLSELFLEQMEFSPFPGALDDVPSQNVSMHRRKTLFLSQVPKQDARLARIVLNTVEQSDAIKDDGIKYMMSPAQRSQFLSRFLEGNEQLRARYNIDELDWFPPATLSDEEWTPPDPINPPEYTGIMLEALKTLGRTPRE